VSTRREPTAKTEYFPSGTRRPKIDITRREADCFVLTYPTQTRFALGSRLDRQSSPLRGYRSFYNPTPSLGK